MVAAILLLFEPNSPLRAAPGETTVDPYIALLPAAPIDPAERILNRKDIVFEQPIGWPVAARLESHAEAGKWGPNFHRINMATILQGRPFTGNFGDGKYGNYAFCGESEFRRDSWEPGRWKTDHGGLCLFDSNGDGKLDEWRPGVVASRFTTKTDPFPPVAYSLVTNYPLGKTLQLSYTGNSSNLAKAFAVKLNWHAPISVPFEIVRQDGEWTILRFQGAELAVSPAQGKAVRLRVLKPFEEGAPFVVMTTMTLRTY
ncbi:MAG: hypothetical protein DI568_02845 [Sphingomonas sp.]|nr:MAG: hypothetical protein DI568_02845 [Sphingomonas sp.]